MPELDRLVAQPGPGKLSLSGTAYGQDVYQVRGTVQAGQVTSAHCSCPVGGGGTCKHAAALLTRSAELPGDFQHVPPLSERLGPLTTGQLHRLIKQLLSASLKAGQEAQRFNPDRSPQVMQPREWTALG